MRKLIKWLLGGVAIVATLLVLAIILLPLVFDPNEHKPRIQQMAADAIGREVILNGPIEWSVFPWIAINLSKVDVVNEKGFKGDYLAQVDQVSARVKLLPLLSKQIQIGQIELQQPKINLQVAQSGNTNWQSILNELNQNEEKTATDSDSHLEISGIEISQGELSYVEGDIRVLMTDLNFVSDAISQTAATDMSLSAHINIPTADLTGQFSSAWMTDGLTTAAGPVFNFKDLSFDGQLTGVPLYVASEQALFVDIAQDKMNSDAIQMSLGSMSFSTSLSGNHLSNQMDLSGTIQMEAFSLAELMAEMGSPLINQANNQLSGSVQWSLLGDRLKLNELDFKLDESSVKGFVDIKNISSLQGQFELIVDQLNLDLYLPESDGDSVAASDSSSELLDLGQMKGQVKMGQLQAAGVHMDDITLSVQTDGHDLMIEPLQAGFYQGIIKTELKLQADNDTEKLQFNHSMQNFQAGGLLTDLMGTDYLTGLGQLNATLKIDEPFSERPLKTANGSFSYTLSDGEIVGIDVFQIMQKSLSLLNKSDLVKNSDELKTAFGLMDIKAQVKQGVLKTQSLKVTSPYFDLSGEVEIDLDLQTIKGTIRPMLTNIPEGLLDQKFEKLLNLRIPVSLSGDLLAPDVAVDFEKLILESQKAKIDEKKAELKEDLFDALLGSKKDNKDATEPTEDGEVNTELSEQEKKEAEKDQMKRDLLEGLFKSSKNKNKQTEDETDDGGN